MSAIIISIFVGIFIVGCIGSWLAAVRWQNRTRDAVAEDPKDQEIRELTAALSVARKDAETARSASGNKGGEIAELQEKLRKTGDSLTNIREKYNATKETLDKEIDGREELHGEMTQLGIELRTSKTRVQELELRASMDATGSGYIAGLDDVLDDDEKETFTIRQEHKQMKEQVIQMTEKGKELAVESERWKQHCAVLSKTNKEFRCKIDDFAGADETIETLQQENSSLQTRIDALDQILEENEQLLAKVNTLQVELGQLKAPNQKMQEENSSLQVRIDALNHVLEDNEQLLADVKKLKAELDELEASGQQMDSGPEEMPTQDELEQLRSQVKELSSAREQVEKLHKQELNQAQEQVEELREQVDELSQAQEQVEELREQADELNQAQAQVEELRKQVDEMNQAREQVEELREQAGELRQAQEQEQVEKLREQGRELSQAQAQVEKLRERLRELNRTQALADEQLTQEQQDNVRLHEQLDKLSTVHADSERLKTELDELNRQHSEISKFDSEIEAKLSLEQEETKALRERIDNLTGELKQGRSTANAFDNVQPEVQALGDEEKEAESLDNTDSMPVLDLENDDLQKIKGIGNQLEQKLNMLGITNFRSLLALTPEDYERAHELIPSLQSRVKRDKWMVQARSLHKEKYNEAL